MSGDRTGAREGADKVAADLRRALRSPSGEAEGPDRNPLVPCYHCGRMVDELGRVDSDEEGM